MKWGLRYYMPHKITFQVNFFEGALMPDDSRTRLRNELLAGAASKPTTPADSQYFKHLRHRITPPNANQQDQAGSIKPS
ncbi:hypothetical protein PSEUDO8O_50236 [Pseudomonas sp. 8O]|nr:hypothetical protein PSEUDO8O_50236 [Pseudomonas sp. 8O]